MQLLICGRLLPSSAVRVRGGITRQLWIAMRLTIILLTVAFLQVSANGHTQGITYQGKDVRLEKVFESIEKQTSYAFFYNDADLRKASPVTINLKSVSLEEALVQLLKEQPLTFAINGKTIVISAKQVSADKRREEEPLSPPIDVKGRIINEKNEAVNATVTVKGTKKATGTEVDGTFSLKDIDEDAVLVITGVGIESREVRVNGSTDLTSIVVKIKATPMDELQVIAYGTTSKRFNVGAVTTITSEEIKKQPVTNVFLALQGRVPGLVVTPGSGAPGATVKVQVRGQNSLVSASGLLPYDQPLIIIDGVPFAPQNQNVNLVPSFGGGYPNGSSFTGFSGLNSINPADIESISVLRDADATSIYGSQGANGVILITTKKGKPGKTNFDLNFSTGPNKITRRIKFLNTEQYIALRREALQMDGITLPPVYDGQYPDLQLFDTTKYTNWFDKFFGKTSNNTFVHASLNGGTENISFIINAGYNHSTYNFPGDFAEKMFTLHSALRFRSKNNRLFLDFVADFSFSHNNNAASPDVMLVNKFSPNLPDLLDENGNLVWNYKGFNLGGTPTPNSYEFYQQYAYLKQPSNLKKYNFNNSLQLTYRLFKGLNATVNVGYSRLNTNEIAQFPKAASDPSNVWISGTATFAKNEFETINAEPQLTYQRTIGKGVLTVLAGATYKHNINQNEMVTGAGYTNDAFLGSLSGAGRIAEAQSNNVVYKYIGAFGRLGYIHDNKYILNITGRRDGSSNFGPGRQFGNFASIGAGWIISDENFFSDLKPAFSLLKLSGNYGTNGSDGVEPYSYQDFWGTDQYTNPFQGNRPYFAINLYNPDYSWALKKSLNLTLDVGLLNDNLLLNINWYRNRMGNQLVGILLPMQTGFLQVIDNQEATVQNTGLEIAVSSTNIKRKDFTWTSSFNFSINRNKLIEFKDLESSAYSYYYTIGKSTSVVRGFRYAGINDTTGLYQFYDAKGNLTYNPENGLQQFGGDLTDIADMQPVFQGGFGNTFTYKGISLSVFFQFAKQTSPSYMASLYNGTSPGLPYNMPVQVLDHWRQPGDRSEIQRVTADWAGQAITTGQFFMQSNGVYTDASYIRLKTLSLSYSFPSAFIKKAGMDNMQLFINAQNLLTITGYEVGDPEMGGNTYAMPLQRTISMGLSVNL